MVNEYTSVYVINLTYRWVVLDIILRLFNAMDIFYILLGIIYGYV